MTTMRRQECAHCLDEYTYYPSAYGHSLPPYNHEKWCATCFKAVRDALQAVPRKFERVYVNVTDISLETLFQWEREAEARRSPGVVYARRVSFPLFDLKNGTSDRSGYVRGPDRVEYHYRYWEGRESEVEITKPMKRCIATGELTPWYGWS